ncbi:leukocyte elastase inhibitor-like isoform X2 [Periophthalmus magnuspinnatus]|uniref:leukocyte elastase inhibitor-like isoform X2 n=1 Tax=Periophthalmus magnuspinnatus TaxID=409849 RepID=UPI00145C107A|nr:leukocyte elastase inhibitor-like isoform X2 [Periophthalmus magnuspinnatus]
MESEMLPKANTTFALALYKKLKEELKDINGNIFCSPFSISAALAMVMLGARGNTATQMSEVLSFSEPIAPPPGGDLQCSLQTDRPYLMQSQMQTRMQMRTQIQRTSRLPAYLRKCLKPENAKDDIDASFAQLLSELYKPEALYVLSIANRLYGEKQYTFDKTFLAETKKHYKAELETVDFASNAEASREHINNWVEEQTQGKITDLLPSGVVSASTRLVLVNAIYFKGKWSSQFQEENTTDGEFRLNKTDTKPVKLMMQKAKFHFSFIEEVKCKVLEMPYEGNDLSMVIILPKDIEDETTGLEMLEQMLTYDKFKEWTGRDTMGFVEVKVRLPRFKMEESYDLKEVLKSMGMVDAFDVARSDFSGMSSANDLVLSEVRHKAFVEVNEEGTEAAAATGAVINERAAMITETFDGDHPFLFFIRHNPSNSVLFAGRFSSPE